MMHVRMSRSRPLLRKCVCAINNTMEQLSAAVQKQGQRSKRTSRPAPTPFGPVWHPSQPKALPARPGDGLPPGRNSSAARAYMLAEAARKLGLGRAGLRGERVMRVVGSAFGRGDGAGCPATVRKSGNEERASRESIRTDLWMYIF